VNWVPLPVIKNDGAKNHVVMLAGQDLVTGANNKLLTLIVKPLTIAIGDGGAFLQGA